MCNMKIVKVNVTSKGEVDMGHLKEMCEVHKDDLGAIMVTYPSTYGVFDETISEICDTIHRYGGQVSYFFVLVCWNDLTPLVS